MGSQGKVRPAVVTVALDLLLQAGGRSRLQVSGYSMAPLLRPGDTVVVEHTWAVRVGDIVVRRSDAGLVVHRVVQVVRTDNDQFRILTKGDATMLVDTPAVPDDIVGRVVALERGRVIELDSGLWRGLGWLAAHYSYLSGRFYRLTFRLRRRLPRQPELGWTVVGRLGLRLMRFPLWLMGFLLDRQIPYHD